MHSLYKGWVLLGERSGTITQWIKGISCTFGYYPITQRLVNERLDIFHKRRQTASAVD
jgi:hypothetical protein